MASEESGRKRIVQVARDMFMERGFTDVSMQQIADAAGLRKASIYHHFPSKVDLFVAVAWLEIDELHEQTQAAIKSSDDLVRQLEAVARVWLSSVRGDRGRLARELQEHVPASQQSQFEERVERFIATIASAFEPAAAAGHLREIEPKTAAAVYFDIVCGSLYRAYLDPTAAAIDPEQTIRTLTDILLFGIASPEFARDHRAGCCAHPSPADAASNRSLLNGTPARETAVH